MQSTKEGLMTKAC